MSGLFTNLTTLIAYDQTMNGAYSILDPINDIIYYFFPKFGTMFSGCKRLSGKDCRLYDSIESRDERQRIRKVIRGWADAVGLHRKVTPFVSAMNIFSSYGGRFSLTSPVLQIPEDALVRKKYGNYGAQTDEEALKNDFMLSTDDETSFQIVRSLVHLKKNNSMFKWIARVMMVTAIVLLKISPLTWPISIALFLIAVLGYFVIDNYVQNQLDSEAVEVLTQHLGKQRAVEVALSVLKKQKEQNLERKNKGGFFGNLLITPEGNERFNLTAPSLSKRTQKLEARKLEVQREFEEWQGRTQGLVHRSLVSCP